MNAEFGSYNLFFCMRRSSQGCKPSVNYIHDNSQDVLIKLRRKDSLTYGIITEQYEQEGEGQKRISRVCKTLFGISAHSMN